MLQVNKVEETNERLLAALKGEKEELVSSLSKEKMQTLQLKQELTEAENRSTDLYKVTFLAISPIHFASAVWAKFKVTRAKMSFCSMHEQELSY